MNWELLALTIAVLWAGGRIARALDRLTRQATEINLRMRLSEATANVKAMADAITQPR